MKRKLYRNILRNYIENKKTIYLLYLNKVTTNKLCTIYSNQKRNVGINRLENTLTHYSNLTEEITRWF